MSTLGQDINAVTRTIYGTYLQTVRMLGLNFTLPANTTLNEKYNVESGTLPPSGQLPRIGYMAIGNRGHQTIQAADGSDETIPIPHRATDAGLFGQIPFVLRPVDEDLTSSERANYAIRVRETHEGSDYFAYYLRRLNMTGVTADLKRVETVDNEIQTQPFVPTADNLNPDPPTITNQGVIVGSNISYMASAIVTVELTAADITEIMNAHQIRTGSNRSPAVSEIGMVSGIDKTVQGLTAGGSTFNYDEAIAAQIALHVSTYHAIGYASNSAVFTIDFGGTEPMIGEDSVGSST